MRNEDNYWAADTDFFSVHFEGGVEKMTELNEDFYCSVDQVQMGEYEPSQCYGKAHGICKECSAYHRKWPTPAQFYEKYGRDWEGAVYDLASDGWRVFSMAANPIAVVCACTPFGKPPDNWRPKEETEE